MDSYQPLASDPRGLSTSDIGVSITGSGNDFSNSVVACSTGSDGSNLNLDIKGLVTDSNGFYDEVSPDNVYTGVCDGAGNYVQCVRDGNNFVQ